MQDGKFGKTWKNRGIKQECKVFLVMFVVCMSRLIDGFNEVWKEDRYYLLMFADDVSILWKSRKEIKAKKNVYRVECRMLGLSINEDKSKIMRMSKNV